MFDIIYLEEVSSTNLYAKKNLHKLKDKTLIYTFNQVGGYGQQGSRWHSVKDKDIACSFVVKPKIRSSELFVLNQIASLSVLRTLQNLCEKDIRIKWPNDVLINDKKVSGILVENQFIGNQIDTSIIGIGINVNSEGVNNVVFPATSLYLEVGSTFDLHKVVFQLLEQFKTYYEMDTKLVRKEYINNLWRLGEPCMFEDKSGTFTGKIIDVMTCGKLVICDETGNTRKYYFKEVRFLI